MDKRATWREQEQQLIARWNAANERYRAAHTGNQTAEAEAARAELEVLRRQVARLKVEFTSGKRY
ncbi:MAG TPA: hypothetical protein VMJ14_11755 [Burkholderiales bacterium]|nr:hypothetical protein [Burkholderiales bacterium]